MVSGINDYVFFGIVAITAVIAVNIFAWAVFRKGLAIRIFGIVTPSMGTIGFLGYVVGKVNTLTNMFFCVTIAAVFGSISIAVLNRIVVKRYRSHIEDLMAGVAQLSTTAQQTSATANEQSSAVGQVSTTSEEMKAMSENVANNAEMVLTQSVAAVRQGKEGMSKIEEASLIMQAVGQVREIVDTVNNLAEQSNLLAVNASIEAAKAGEYGRGFSVVASEVRNLAEQSKAATLQIREAISRTEEGRAAIARVQHVIQEMVATQEASSDSARQISGAIAQQTAGIRQIADAMRDLSEGSVQTTNATTLLGQAGNNLRKVGNDMRFFVTGEHEGL